MQASRVLARRPCAVFFAGGVQLSSAESDGASGEILPCDAVSAEGLHAPGGGPGGVTSGGADVQRSHRPAAGISPAHQHPEGEALYALGDRKTTQLLAAMIKADRAGG